jgi:hypothetical protein
MGRQMGKTMLSKSVFVAGLGVAAALPTTRAVHAADSPAIHTVFASYGYAMERKDVKDDVVKFCDGKPSCSFTVKNETFTQSKGAPDPSPGNDKGLLVAWKCGTTDHKEQFAEGRTARVDCGSDSIVPPAAAPAPK